MPGISRAQTGSQGQAEPIRKDDVVEMLRSLGTSAIDLRDGALLACGYLFAGRRSEIAALDFHELGDGDGFIRISARTIDLKMGRSKTIKNGEPEEVTVPRAPLAMAVTAIERWVDHAKIKPGEPLFRRVAKGGIIGRALAADATEDDSGGRLHPQSVSLIIKRRVAEHLERQGSPRDKAREDAARFSGHSLRVGFAVSAAEAGVSVERIATVTRHRSLEMPRRYAAKAKQLRLSPYNTNGVGTDFVPEDKKDSNSRS